MSRRTALFSAVVVACVVAAVTFAMLRRRAAPPTSPSSSRPDAVALAPLLRQPHVLYRSTRLDALYGQVVVNRLDDRSGARVSTGLACERFDFAGGTGVCLTASRGVTTTYAATIVNGTFEPLKTVPLTGIPSRVRVSPDGRLAGVTVFVSGHAYSQSEFSTNTRLLDTETGEALADLESFAVTRNGSAFKREDFNFWGVTFAQDSKTFYATLSSAGVYYLVRADAVGRRAEVIAEGVECPSLSPDNTRIAFKKRELAGGQFRWRVAVLDLATGAQRVGEQETRSVDDQVEWLDNDHILYALPSAEVQGSLDIWSLGWDGAPPERFLADAYSPAIP